jgi:hypothetical protein
MNETPMENDMTDNEQAQVIDLSDPRDERRVKIAGMIDDAHKAVSDALKEIYALHRETAVYHDLSSGDLRQILKDLERIGNEYDAEVEG